MHTFTNDLAIEVNLEAAELKMMQLWRIHLAAARKASVDPYLFFLMFFSMLLRSMGHGEAGHVSTSRLAALAMAVAAEDRAAWRMYGELLSADGACVDVRGVGQYVGLDDEEGRRLAFWDVARAVQRAGHTLLGYRRRGEGWAAAAAAGTLVNPPGKGEPRVWEAGDDLVVLRINSAPAAQP